MAEKKPLLVYAAAYETVEAALADLDAIEQAHKDEVIGQYDAAVIDKEDGKPHVVKRMDRPHIRVIPEWFGGGTLPRKELHEAAAQLTANQAGLIAVGEPTIEKGLDKALTKAAKVVKRTVEATTTKSPASCRKRSRADAAAAVKAALSGVGFLVEATQHRRLKTVGTRGFSGRRRIPIGADSCWLRAPILSCPEIGVGGLGGAGALLARRPGGARRSGSAAPPAG